MALPLSIPSPPYDPWQVPIHILPQLHDILPIWPEAGLSVHMYAICILLGIIAAILLGNHRLKSRGAEPGVILDISIGAVAGGVVGARLFHVVTHPDDYFGPGKDLIKIFAVWEGGVAYYGALLGGAIGVLIVSRMIGLRFISVLDAIAPGMLIAQAFGRLGNWFNHELYGLPTDLPWGLEIEQSNSAWPTGLPEGTLFHPTFLYEIVWNLLGLAILLAADRRLRFQWGKMLALYLIWQGIGRSFFESIRVDPSEYYFGVRANVWAAIGAIALGLILFVVQTRRHPGLEPSVYLPGRQWTPDAGVDSGDTYSDTDELDDVDAADSAEEPATSGATVTK